MATRPDSAITYKGVTMRRSEAEDRLRYLASRTDAQSVALYHELNSQMIVDPDTGLSVDRETYDEAAKLWNPSVGSDFFEGTWAHAITPELLRKAKNTVTARREQQGVAAKDKEVLDSYLKLIKESPNATRGQTLLTSGRAGSNSILGSPIDPMKTVLT